jgi:hypothetical protein
MLPGNDCREGEKCCRNGECRKEVCVRYAPVTANFTNP